MWEEVRKDCFLESFEGEPGPADTISDFWSPELCENIFLLS